MEILTYLIGVIVAYLVIGVMNYIKKEDVIDWGFCFFSWLILIALVLLYLAVRLAGYITKHNLNQKLSPRTLIERFVNLFKPNKTIKQVGKVKIVHNKKTKNLDPINKPTTDPNAFNPLDSHWGN